MKFKKVKFKNKDFFDSWFYICKTNNVILVISHGFITPTREIDTFYKAIYDIIIDKKTDISKLNKIDIYFDLLSCMGPLRRFWKGVIVFNKNNVDLIDIKNISIDKFPEKLKEILLSFYKNRKNKNWLDNSVITPQKRKYYYSNPLTMEYF